MSDWHGQPRWKIPDCENHAMSQSAHIVGIVEVRQGDGTMQVTQGPIGVYTTEIDATLSWSDGNTYAVVAMPLTDYERHLATGSIRVDPLPPA